MKLNLGKRQKESQLLIQQACLNLLSKMEYGQITIAKICTEATVSRNTFYRIFNSKEDVLESIIKEKVEHIIDAFEETDHYDFLRPEFRDHFQSYQRYYTYWKQQQTFLSLLVTQNLFDVFYIIHERYIVNVASEHIVRVLQYTQSQKKYYYKWLSFSLACILEEWAETGFAETPEELAELTIQLYKSMAVINSKE